MFNEQSIRQTDQSEVFTKKRLRACNSRIKRTAQTPAERCRSGRTGRSRKPLFLHGNPGFESLSLRHYPPDFQGYSLLSENLSITSLSTNPLSESAYYADILESGCTDYADTCYKNLAFAAVHRVFNEPPSQNERGPAKCEARFQIINQ